MRITRRSIRNVSIALIAGSLLSLLPVAGAGPAGAAPARAPARPLGPVPAAAAQPTALGRQITDLQVHNGRIYAGFGDWYANTGPIAVTSFTPGPDAFAVEHIADTEAITGFRELGGRLVAPSTDPRVAADYSSGGPWAARDAVGAAHVFDMNTTDGRDLWMVGSAGPDAVAWRSLDGGATWTETLRVPPVTLGDVARFYFAGVLRGELHLQAVDGLGPQAGSLVFGGGTWRTGPSLVGRLGTGWHPVEFAGRMFYPAWGRGLPGRILSFDGQRVRGEMSGYDVEVAEGALWALDDRGNVRRSTNGVRWTTVATVPKEARSLTVLGGVLYVGTADSQLLSLVLG